MQLAYHNLKLPWIEIQIECPWYRVLLSPGAHVRGCCWLQQRSRLIAGRSIPDAFAFIEETSNVLNEFGSLMNKFKCPTSPQTIDLSKSTNCHQCNFFVTGGTGGCSRDLNLTPLAAFSRFLPSASLWQPAMPQVTTASWWLSFFSV